MRKVCIAGAAVLALTVLSGCGTTGAGVAGAEAGYDSNVDKAQVAALETVAKQRGVRIYWMQYPTKPATAAPAATTQ
ncbi:hypothetical protein V8J88_23125 [Massilia sp. W12]|uniref:hypothetical protein n=1 Tax=Massilia sp. W12 TaxID=3126507 RepID=UPI0030D56CC2